MKRITVPAMALAVALVAALPVGAGAAPKDKAQAQVLGTVVTNADGTASVRARYICPEAFTCGSRPSSPRMAAATRD